MNIEIDKNFNLVQKPVEINVVLTHVDAKLPTKSYDHALGWDIYVVPDEEWNSGLGRPYFVLAPHTGHTFHTGIIVGTNPKNYGFLLRDRSSLGVKDVSVKAGVIEGVYRGEWLVRLYNNSNSNIVIYSGDKICQAILTEIIPANISQVSSLDETERGDRGFGSSGR